MNSSTYIISMKVYFNNSCSVCRTEINLYKKQENLKDVEWIDVSNNSFSESFLSRDSLYRRLHVYDHGRLVKGARAFLLIWGKLPKLKKIKKFIEMPFVYPFFYLAYEVIAIILYWKNNLRIKFNKNL